MFLDTMTIDELRDEAIKDANQMLGRMMGYINSRNAAYGRYLMNHRDIGLKYFETKVMNTPRGNRLYLMPFSTNGYADFKKRGIAFQIVYIFKRGNVNWGLRVSVDRVTAYIYPAHLFKRYELRHNGNPEASVTEDVILNYFKENLMGSTQIDTDGNVYMYGAHGVVLGTTGKTDETVLMKTYVSPEMLREEQAEINEGLRDRLNDYLEKKRVSEATAKRLWKACHRGT